MRIPVGAGLVLVAAVTLAACASATGGPVPPVGQPHASPSAGQPHASPSARQSAAVTPGPAAGSRAEAAAQARLMLSRLRLPPGARMLPPVPRPPSLVDPASSAGGGATSLDQYRLFALRQSMDASAAFFAARVPAGMTYSGTGQGSSAGAVSFKEVGYQAQPVPAGIYEAQLVLTVVPAGSGRSLLRADAQVIWYPPRTAAEYIDPARYHVLTVTVMVSGVRPHTVHAVVTSPAFITRLAASLDRSQAEPDIAIACPADFADYQLAFSVSRHSRPVVVVRSNQSGCGGSQVTVDGRQQPSLTDGGAVAALVDQVVSVHWQS